MQQQVFIERLGIGWDRTWIGRHGLEVCRHGKNGNGREQSPVQMTPYRQIPNRIHRVTHPGGQQHCTNGVDPVQVKTVRQERAKDPTAIENEPVLVKGTGSTKAPSDDSNRRRWGSSSTTAQRNGARSRCSWTCGRRRWNQRIMERITTPAVTAVVFFQQHGCRSFGFG